MTDIHLQATVPDDCHGQRLDQTLAHLFSAYSRAQLQKWIKSGQVRVDGNPITRTRHPVCAGNHIEIETQIVPKEHWGAQAMPLSILYEDTDLIVINKPAGLVVHPGAGTPDQTLVNALLHHFPELAKLPRAGIVHRIDKDTSGLLVVARTLIAHHALVKALQARTIERTYEAIVLGEMLAGGTVDVPIGRHPTARTKMAVVPTGKPACTHYRVLAHFPYFTHVALKLETGRTHQIRVHMAHIHFPLLGDPVYARRHPAPASFRPETQSALNAFHRQALHAKKLVLIHPTTQETLTFEAPLPVDMREMLALLQQEKERSTS